MQRRNMMAMVAGFWSLAVPASLYAQAAAPHVHSDAEIKIGPYEVVLAVRGNEASLTLLDAHERPVEAAPFSATGVALARGNERRNMEFRPAGANRLTATVDFPFDGKFRVTITLRGPGGMVGTGRYNIDPTR